MYGNPQLRKEAGISKSSAKKLAKTKHEGLPEKVSEAMNFTEFLEATKDIEPIYQVEGEFPKCPRGYVYDRKTKRCIPKTERDDVGNAKNSKDNTPDNGPGYGVFGNTGIDGDGYAYAEKVGWGSDNMSIGSDNP